MGQTDRWAQPPQKHKAVHSVKTLLCVCVCVPKTPPPNLKASASLRGLCPLYKCADAASSCNIRAQQGGWGSAPPFPHAPPQAVEPPVPFPRLWLLKDFVSAGLTRVAGQVPPPRVPLGSLSPPGWAGVPRVALNRARRHQPLTASRAAWPGFPAQCCGGAVPGASPRRELRLGAAERPNKGRCGCGPSASRAIPAHSAHRARTAPPPPSPLPPKTRRQRARAPRPSRPRLPPPIFFKRVAVDWPLAPPLRHKASGCWPVPRGRRAFPGPI